LPGQQKIIINAPKVNVKQTVQLVEGFSERLKKPFVFSLGLKKN
jgi:hypothetical protein